MLNDRNPGSTIMYKKLILLSLIILGASSGTELYSQSRHGVRMRFELRQGTPPPGTGFGHLGGICFGDDNYMRETLNLSDSQIKNISQINKDYGNRLFSLRSKLRPLNNDLRDLLLSKNIDLKKVRAILTEISGIEIEIRITKIEHRIAIENIFTPDQLEILNKEKRWMRRGNQRND